MTATAPQHVRASALVLALLLAGCASTPVRRPAPIQPIEPPAPATAPPSSALPPAKPNQIPQQYGGYYQDDGPILAVPYDLDALPEPVPQAEPLHRFANRPYSVFGQTYTPLAPNAAFTQEGVASWYGRKFNGKNTASGEPYDMFKLTAAHPTLPVPSYARVTNLENGKSVVVRINDRGPFHKNRVMDMSYAAAYRLGFQNRGSAKVRIEALAPGETAAAAPVQAAVAPRPALTAQAPLPPVADPIGALAGADSLNSATTPNTPSDTGVGVPPTVVAPSAPPVAMADPFWLQLGAFGSQAAAETFKAHVADDVVGVAPLAVVPAGKIWRVRLGPFADRDTAGQAADKLASLFPQKPVLVR